MTRKFHFRRPGHRITRRTVLGAAVAAVLAGSSKAADAKHVSWLSDVQRAPVPLPPDAPKLSPLLVREGSPITTLDEWKQRREELRRAWLKKLGPWTNERPAKVAFETLSDATEAGIRRRLVRYSTEPEVAVEAYLVQPAEPREKMPGVVALHSTVDVSIDQPAGLEGEPTLHFGPELARRGMTVLCPRNFLWTSAGKLLAREQAAEFLKRRPGSLGMMKMLHDAQVALDLLTGLPEVDAARLGAVGHSLGGKEALYLAAFDERVQCTVSSEGGVGLSFSNWHDAWYLGEQARQPEFGREHHELLALAAPRAFLLVGGDSADGDRSWPYVSAALDVYRLYGSPAPLGLLNHKAGHKLPPDSAAKVYAWLEAYL